MPNLCHCVNRVQGIYRTRISSTRTPHLHAHDMYRTRIPAACTLYINVHALYRARIVLPCMQYIVLVCSRPVLFTCTCILVRTLDMSVHAMYRNVSYSYALGPCSSHKRAYWGAQRLAYPCISPDFP